MKINVIQELNKINEEKETELEALKKEALEFVKENLVLQTGFKYITKSDQWVGSDEERYFSFVEKLNYEEVWIDEYNNILIYLSGYYASDLEFINLGNIDGLFDILMEIYQNNKTIETLKRFLDKGE